MKYFLKNKEKIKKYLNLLLTFKYFYGIIKYKLKVKYNILIGNTIYTLRYS